MLCFTYLSYTYLSTYLSALKSTLNSSISGRLKQFKHFLADNKISEFARNIY